MERRLGRYSAYIYALLRIVAGFLFFQHGLPKLFGGFGRDTPAEMTSQMGVAGIIEVVGGALISIGLFTSPVAFIASGEVAVAYFQAHLPRGFWPIVNGGELAALYCFVFLYFAAMGSGSGVLTPCANETQPRTRRSTEDTEGYTAGFGRSVCVAVP